MLQYGSATVRIVVSAKIGTWLLLLLSQNRVCERVRKRLDFEGATLSRKPDFEKVVP